MDLKNKRVTVIGLGRSGFAAAKFLARYGARVFATDASAKAEVVQTARLLKNLGVAVETGGHTAASLCKSSLVVASPGVPKTNPVFMRARGERIPVISEIELASRFCKGKIIGITGSNGKTTTSHLMHRVLKDAGNKSVLCGNVGRSFLDAMPQIDRNTWVVLELSSFQLESSPSLRPRVAVVLNISPNHLDRHRTLANYVNAKKNIFLHQKRSDTLILNFDDPRVRKMARESSSRVVFFSKEPLKKGVFLENGCVVVRQKGAPCLRLAMANFGLKGSHNLENIMAVAAVSYALGIPEQFLQRTLDDFKTLAHRVEPLGEINGVRLVNDSKSTTVDSTLAAIRAIETPIVLIAGGRDKGADFTRLEPLLVKRVKAAVLYGEAREKIAASWGVFRQCKLVGDFNSAVRLGFSLCSPGDTLLLSPMCTSFDQFSSFEARGEAFKRLGESLKRRRPAKTLLSTYVTQ